jgi:hypothetical protein
MHPFGCRREIDAMDTDREITAIKSLQHVSIDRVEVLTDRIESLTERLKLLEDLLNEPASSALSDALKGLASVVGQLSNNLTALPRTVADELERRRTR